MIEICLPSDYTSNCILIRKYIIGMLLYKKEREKRVKENYGKGTDEKFWKII